MSRKPRLLKIKLRGEISESPPRLGVFSQKRGLAFPQLLNLLKRVLQTSNIRSVALIIEDLRAGWAQIEELHQALDKLHARGIVTISFLHNPDNRAYYLAAGTREIFMTPAAVLNLVGLRVETFFLRNLFDLLGVTPELFSVGDYKSSAEMFLRRDMSSQHREMLEAILSDLQSRMVEKIASQRAVPAEVAAGWIDRGPYSGPEALEAGLIDRLLYEDELESVLADRFPGIATIESTKLRVRESLVKRLLTARRAQIAYIVADGIITSSESRRGYGTRRLLGARTIIPLLETARRSKRVKAVVLRVNCPGGSGTASDRIWREIELTRRKKPVIVSFGEVAASGGYYIATASSRILAASSTLTGSIGVIGGKFSVAGLLDQLGINPESVDAGKHAGYLSITRPFTREEADRLKAHLHDFYERLFLSKVAESRKADVETIRAVAEGRVWTGGQAVQHGLVDAIGGIDDALSEAGRQAGLKGGRYRVITYAAKRSWRDLLPFNPAGPLGKEEVLALMPEDYQIR